MNVGEVAAVAGVAVRTLPHCGRIGLLSPSGPLGRDPGLRAAEEDWLRRLIDVR